MTRIYVNQHLCISERYMHEQQLTPWPQPLTLWQWHWFVTVNHLNIPKVIQLQCASTSHPVATYLPMSIATLKVLAHQTTQDKAECSESYLMLGSPILLPIYAHNSKYYRCTSGWSGLVGSRPGFKEGLKLLNCYASAGFYLVLLITLQLF